MQKRSGSVTNRQSFTIIILVCSCFLFVYLLHFLIPGNAQLRRGQVNDLLFKLRYAWQGKEKISPYVLHTVIADSTYESTAESINNGIVYGRTLDLLNGAGAAGIVCDLFFASDLPPGLETAAINGRNVYFPVFFYPAPLLPAPGLSSACPEAERFLWKRETAGDRAFPAAAAMKQVAAPLAKAARGMGHINFFSEADGIIRLYPLLYRYREGYYPSLTLAAVCDYLKVDQNSIIIKPGQHIILPAARRPYAGQRDIVIPIDQAGRVIINFAGLWDDSFIRFPVQNLWAAAADPGQQDQLYDTFADSLVFFSDISTRHKDFGTTPLETVYPLSGIHLNLINMILTENFLYYPSPAGILLPPFLAVLLLAAGAIFLKPHFFYPAALLGLLAFGGFCLLNFLIFKTLAVVVPFSGSYLLSLLLISVYRFVTEKQQHQLTVARHQLEKTFYRESARDLSLLLSLIRGPVELLLERLSSLSPALLREQLTLIRHHSLKLEARTNTIIDLSLQRSGETAAADHPSPTGPVLPEKQSSHYRLLKQTILILEPDPGLRQFLTASLKHHYRVICAPDGKEGLKLTAQAAPDVVLCSNELPGLPANNWLLRFRQQPANTRVPVILLVTGGRPLIPPGSELAVWADYLPVPFHYAELSACIENQLQINAGRQVFAIPETPPPGPQYPHNPLLLYDADRQSLGELYNLLSAHEITNLLPCSDHREILLLMEKMAFSAVIMDPYGAGSQGDALVAELIGKYPGTQVVICSVYNDTSTAVGYMRKGVRDFLPKPADPADLLKAVRKAVSAGIRYREAQNTGSCENHPGLQNPAAFISIVTGNRQMLNLFKQIEAFAPGAEPILITGENGSGKELVARAIHNISRGHQHFVPVNIAGIDETLFSDMLFGHIRGAFTGAAGDKAGLIRKAGQGSLFLDEIGDLTPGAQVKLLRLLQDRTYYPLGADTQELSLSRIILATNRDLKQLVDQKLFRMDLFYRITHKLHLPPLRERFDDLPLLLNHFLLQLAAERGAKALSYSPHLVTLLRTYPFPGNIRELQLMLKNAVSLNRGMTLMMEYFRDYIAQHKPPEPVDEPGPAAIQPFNIGEPGQFPRLKKVESYLIQQAMQKAGGNQAVAAGLLGISPATLHRRLKKK